MHIASVLGIPTVAIFGPTSEWNTGPTGSVATTLRHPVECSPCLLHTCPIDHRCMSSVHADLVAATLVRLVQKSQI